MNDREKAIVMAYTGVCMLTGDRLNEFYKYLAELYGRPVYTHEIARLDIRDRAYKDFLALCKETAPSAEKTGEWIEASDLIDNQSFSECKCSECGAVEYFNKGWKRFNYCPNCGARMEG